MDNLSKLIRTEKKLFKFNGFTSSKSKFIKEKTGVAKGIKHNIRKRVSKMIGEV